MKQVKVLNAFGAVSMTYDITNTSITRTYGDSKVTIIYDSNIFTSLPSKSQVSLTNGTQTNVNYYTYYFFYDAARRLIRVSEKTENIPNDNEWDLHISYNADGNVKELKYQSTTGSPTVAIITAGNYDSNQTPYAGVKGWPFMLINYTWDNYDPEPLLTALSKNNPFGYTTKTTRSKMTYKYNPENYPVERMSIDTIGTNVLSFVQTFTYDCD